MGEGNVGDWFRESGTAAAVTSSRHSPLRPLKRIALGCDVTNLARSDVGFAWPVGDDCGPAQARDSLMPSHIPGRVLNTLIAKDIKAFAEFRPPEQTIPTASPPRHGYLSARFRLPSPPAEPPAAKTLVL